MRVAMPAHFALRTGNGKPITKFCEIQSLVSKTSAGFFHVPLFIFFSTVAIKRIARYSMSN